MSLSNLFAVHREGSTDTSIPLAVQSVLTNPSFPQLFSQLQGSVETTVTACIQSLYVAVSSPLQETIASLTTQLNDTIQKLTHEQEALVDIHQQMQASTSLIDTQKVEIERLTSQLAESKAIQVDLTAKCEEATNGLLQHATQLAECEHLLQEARSTIGSQTTTIQELQHQLAIVTVPPSLPDNVPSSLELANLQRQASLAQAFQDKVDRFQDRMDCMYANFLSFSQLVQPATSCWIRYQQQRLAFYILLSTMDILPPDDGWTGSWSLELLTTVVRLTVEEPVCHLSQLMSFMYLRGDLDISDDVDINWFVGDVIVQAAVYWHSLEIGIQSAWQSYYQDVQWCSLVQWHLSIDPAILPTRSANSLVYGTNQNRLRQDVISFVSSSPPFTESFFNAYQYRCTFSEPTVPITFYQQLAHRFPIYLSFLINDPSSIPPLLFSPSSHPQVPVFSTCPFITDRPFSPIPVPPPVPEPPIPSTFPRESLHPILYAFPSFPASLSLTLSSYYDLSYPPLHSLSLIPLPSLSAYINRPPQSVLDTPGFDSDILRRRQWTVDDSLTGPVFNWPIIPGTWETPLSCYTSYLQFARQHVQSGDPSVRLAAHFCWYLAFMHKESHISTKQSVPLLSINPNEDVQANHLDILYFYAQSFATRFIVLLERLCCLQFLQNPPSYFVDEARTGERLKLSISFKRKYLHAVKSADVS